MITKTMNPIIAFALADENASLEKTFTINLIDQNEPPVHGYRINGNFIRILRLMNSLNIEINFMIMIFLYFKTAGGDRNLFNLNARLYSLPKFVSAG